jgi:hypothetical protein
LPLYFFDTDNGEQFVEDDKGIELADREAARREGLAALPDIAQSVIPDSRDARVIAVSIRNAIGTTIYTATLTLAGGWRD